MLCAPAAGLWARRCCGPPAAQARDGHHCSAHFALFLLTLPAALVSIAARVPVSTQTKRTGNIFCTIYFTLFALPPKLPPTGCMLAACVLPSCPPTPCWSAVRSQLAQPSFWHPRPTPWAPERWYMSELCALFVARLFKSHPIPHFIAVCPPLYHILTPISFSIARPVAASPLSHPPAPVSPSTSPHQFSFLSSWHIL